ncbi:MAG TPA: hypothetical protein VFF64_11730 [Candidatus Eremiobacteraceae bacterium]|nr:hypothetical protein [Candidatus Eremiobacteraceae bacterium]
MKNIITKVKKKASGKSPQNLSGWNAVLADIKVGIERLESLVPIVEGKIRRGEAWPVTQSADQSAETCHII